MNYINVIIIIITLINQSLYYKMNLPFLTNHNPAKYKTMLCKHFSSSKGCSFGTECHTRYERST